MDESSLVGVTSAIVEDVSVFAVASVEVEAVLVDVFASAVPVEAVAVDEAVDDAASAVLDAVDEVVSFVVFESAVVVVDVDSVEGVVTEAVVFVVVEPVDEVSVCEVSAPVSVELVEDDVESSKVVFVDRTAVLLVLT